MGATISSNVIVPYRWSVVTHRSTTEGTGAILMSWPGIPFFMYQSIAACESGARPWPLSAFTSCLLASKIRRGTSPPIEQAP